MKKLVLAIALVFVVGFTITSCKSEKKESNETEKEIVKEVEKDVVEKVVVEEDKDMAVAVYQCPMDCEKGKTYDKPGQCPVCKMDLKEKDSDDNHEDHDE